MATEGLGGDREAAEYEPTRLTIADILAVVGRLSSLGSQAVFTCIVTTDEGLQLLRRLAGEQCQPIDPFWHPLCVTLFNLPVHATATPDDAYRLANELRCQGEKPYILVKAGPVSWADRPREGEPWIRQQFVSVLPDRPIY